MLTVMVVPMISTRPTGCSTTRRPFIAFLLERSEDSLPTTSTTATPHSRSHPHPVSLAATVERAPAAAPTSTPVPAAQAGALSVSVLVNPSQIPYGAYPAVIIHTAPRAVCNIKVVYSTGRQPASYLEHMSTADAGGTITEQGAWHMESKGTGGTVSATCTLAGASVSGTAGFTITS